ncbi:hypothetical protein B7P43_G11941, partial [Cryptotermes secundus]
TVGRTLWTGDQPVARPISAHRTTQTQYMCPILNGFRDRAISLYCTLYRQATRHVLTRGAECTDVDGGIFENVLY